MAGALLPICSIIFSGLLCFVYFYKKRIKLVENNVFSVMLIVSFIDSILVSVLQLISKNGIHGLETIIVEVFNKFDFVMLIIFTNCLFLYIMLITYENIRKNFGKIFKISATIDLIVIVFSMLNNVEVISESGNYSIAGTSIFVTIILCAIYLVSALIVALLNIKKADKRYIPIFSIIAIALFLIVLFNINPYLKLFL